MQSRFTKKAQEALDHAAETAAMLGHGYIGSEHLLIGLIQAEDSLASTVLLNNDVTAEKIINLVYQLIAPDNQVGVKEPSGYTPRVRRILENSAKEAARFHADSMWIRLRQWARMPIPTVKISRMADRAERNPHRP